MWSDGNFHHVQCLLMSLNFVFYNVGISQFIAGYILNMERASMKDRTVDHGEELITLFVVGGIVLVCLTFSAFFGIWRRDTYYLIIYGIYFFVLGLLMICASTYYYVDLRRTHANMRASIAAVFAEYKISRVPSIQIDKLQNELRCCGAVSYMDSMLPENKVFLMPSCCPSKTFEKDCNQAASYNIACIEARMREMASSRMRDVYTCTVAAGCVELCMAVLAFYLVRTTRE